MSHTSLLRLLALLTLTLVSCSSVKNSTSSTTTPSLSTPASSVQTSTLYTVAPAGSHQGVVVQGVLTWNEWKKVAQWSNYASDVMVPPPVLGITKGKISTGAYSFVVLGGTWCGDSKRGMPHIFALLEKLEIPEKNIVLIGVNEAKQEPKELCIKYAVAFVPTLIVYRDGVEVGRIVEHPQQSWHDDLAAIVLK
jgi:thiol-disulfide isomerase/thioredoxin